jgi:hypothetical protein
VPARDDTQAGKSDDQERELSEDPAIGLGGLAAARETATFLARQ